jgi:transcriptional regulator with AAA-type ATPase domain
MPSRTSPASSLSLSTALSAIASSVEDDSPNRRSAPRSARTATIQHDARARRNDRFVLEVQGPDDSRLVPLPRRGALVVGSRRPAALQLSDAFVSGAHCSVEVADGRVVITDLDSKNGTYVGGARVTRVQCEAGATVVLGQSTLVLHREDVDVVEPGLPLDGLVGTSIAMRRLADRVRKLAPLSVPVLVSGETGTGKELISRALHTESVRRSGPYIPINVTTLPRDLVESELFGHERGAFTGASNARLGAFAEAEGGTLFLDEIGELPLMAQPKLLRALDGYEVRRVGAYRGGFVPTARLVAATNVALEERVNLGEFRRDLFHRLEVFVIRVPALRERASDIPALAQHLLKLVANEIGPRVVSSRALSLLAARPWEGNIRELRNLLLRAAEFSTGRIEAVHLDRALGGKGIRSSTRPRELHADLVHQTFLEHKKNLSRAAKSLGVSRTSFRRLLQNAEPRALDSEP